MGATLESSLGFTAILSVSPIYYIESALLSAFEVAIRNLIRDKIQPSSDKASEKEAYFHD